MDTHSDKLHIGRYKVRGASVILQKHQRNKLICEYIKRGFTQTDIAGFFKISRARVFEILVKYFPEIHEEIKQVVYNRDKYRKREKIIRNKKIYILYKKGHPVDKIAYFFGISRRRIYQIVKREIAKEKIDI